MLTSGLTANFSTGHIPPRPTLAWRPSPTCETQLEALVLSGEGPQIEFKIELPAASKEARRRVARTVAAFASGDGGSILFGVRNEDGAVIGLPAADVTQAAEDAVDQLRSQLGHAAS